MSKSDATLGSGQWRIMTQLREAGISPMTVNGRPARGLIATGAIDIS